jgi:LuxR family maltose regulon positive regulatory protein
MSTEGAPEPVSRARSHIIERPRLTKLLDESKARILLLVAPAGYGKTTLARQWLGQRPGAWYRATHASGDVAALSLGLARVLKPFAPGLADQVEARLRGAVMPETEVESLVEMLAAEIEPWPTDAWLVIDDYHVCGGVAAAEHFFDLFSTLAPANVLITSRVRPSWLSARRLVYGEIDLIGREELSLSDSEAKSILSRHPPSPLVPELLARARGWPAVIGLAAMTNEVGLPQSGIAQALYDYFAEEIYQGLTDDMRRGLARVSALPSLTQDYVRLVLSDDNDVLETATHLGLLSHHSGGDYDLHPLFRDFLETKLREQDDADVLLRDIIVTLIERAAFDHAYSVIKRFSLTEMLPILLEASLLDMLKNGRLTSLSAWADFAKANNVHSPILNLADAEVARRHGRYERGEVLAVQAASDMGEAHSLTSRALAVAGECALLSLHATHALEHHRRSEAASQNSVDLMRALWGQFTTCIELENGLASQLLERFESLSTGTEGSASSALRASAGRMTVAAYKGAVEEAGSTEARLLHLVSEADDPLAISMFLYRLAFSRLLAGRYAESLRILELARHDVERFGLSFATPHTTSLKAAACLGMRQFRRALYLIETAEDIARSGDDRYVAANCKLLRARYHLARGETDAALQVSDLHPSEIPRRSLRGEAKAIRALALVAADELEEAEQLAEDARGTTSEIETQTLSSLVLASSALRRDESSADDALRHALSTLRSTQNHDSLVWTYRTYPHVLFRIAANSEWRSVLSGILRRAGDLHLGMTAGLLDDSSEPASRISSLSKREREVFELLCQGLSNKEIAKKLYIAEVTTKAHLRSIFSKLGVRTRTEAVLKAHEP